MTRGAITMTDPDTHDQALLTRAASLLDCVGAHRATAAEVALPCLAAAELLERAGGRASRVELIEGQPRPTILAALGALSKLGDDVFRTDHVLRAGRTARRALNLL